MKSLFFSMVSWTAAGNIPQVWIQQLMHVMQKEEVIKVRAYTQQGQ